MGSKKSHPSEDGDLIRCRGMLVSQGPGTWTRLDLDARTSRRLGARGKVRVRGRLNGTPFESVAIPGGDGTHSILVTKPIQASAGVGPGTRVEAEFTVASGPRPFEVPFELSSALRGDPGASAHFDGLAPSHRRAWAEYVGGAKSTETRRRRARNAVDRLRSGIRNPRA